MIKYLPRHVRKLNAEWPHIGIGLTNLTYDVPLKYASFGSSASAGIMTVREKNKNKISIINGFIIALRNNVTAVYEHFCFQTK